MSEPAVTTQDHGPVRLISLNRPQALNALNRDMQLGMIQALTEADDDDAVGAVVITGEGRAFSAGADLAVFAELSQSGDDAAIWEYTDLAFPQAFAGFSKPMIAAINGPAVGWGFTMPLWCDVRLASEQAVFSCAFLKVGVPPEFGSSALLPRIIGLGRATELILSARTVQADEALAMGLVSRVLAPKELMPQALEMGQVFASHSRSALRATRRLLRGGLSVKPEQVLAAEMEAFRRAMASPEHKQAVEKMLTALEAKK